MHALAQTVAIFVQAYFVAPTIVTWWREQQQQPGAGRDDGPVPLQCGSPLRPEHSALLSCRPLALQVLLGLAMVAWPVGLSWAVDRRLRRQHAQLCAECERRRGWQVGEQGPPLTPTQPQRQGTPPPCGPTTPAATASRGGQAAVLGASRDQTSTSATPSASLASPPSGSRLAVLHSSSTTRGRPSALYLSATSTTVVSLKVRRAFHWVEFEVLALLSAAAGVGPGGRDRKGLRRQRQRCRA